MVRWSINKGGCLEDRVELPCGLFKIPAYLGDLHGIKIEYRVQSTEYNCLAGYFLYSGVSRGSARILLCS